MLIIRALQRIQSEHRSEANKALVTALEQTQKAIEHLNEMQDVCVGGDSVGDLIQQLKDSESKLSSINDLFNKTCYGHNYAVQGNSYIEALNTVKAKIDERIDAINKNPDLIRPFANVDDDIPF